MGCGKLVSPSVLWFTIFCVCAIQMLSVCAQKGYNLCDLQGCNCTERAGWKTVNCSLEFVQNIKLTSDFISRNVVEIYIKNGNLIEFTSKTFNSLPGLALLNIQNVKKIVVNRKSFYNISYSSVLIQMKDCDQVIIETGAFEEIQGTIATELTNIGYISIAKSAFTKLHMSTFKNIKKIILAEGTFEFKGHVNTRHGPFTRITFDTVYIPNIPAEVFFSSLADVTFRNSQIDVIESNAFCASEIPAVSFVNVNIGKLKQGAFKDRTLITTFTISKSNISKIESEAIMAAISNLYIKHSIFNEIGSRAIVSTVALAEIIGNNIIHFRSSSFIFTNWNTIKIEENIIKNLHSKFIEAPVNAALDVEFTFKGNEIYNTETGALSFVPELDDKTLIFDDNLFNYLCQCSINSWFEEITNKSKNIDELMNSSYCTINKLLAQCFNLTEDAINIQVFRQKVCRNETKCEPYDGDTKDFNTTSRVWSEDNDFSNKQSWLVLIITLVGLFIIAIVATFIALIVRGSIWLKRKGYFRNIHYNHNEQSNDDENTIVTVDENEKLEMPEELTLEFLQLLSKKLDDPTTHQEASEMIERLYETFIVDDSYGNNNRQEEEAHLYEELGNLNLQIPPPPYEDTRPTHQLQPTSNGPHSILKLIEEMMNPPNNDYETQNMKPQLNGDYSEPSDAAIHFYSELKQKPNQQPNEKKDSLKSNSSSNRMAFRPLPDKPSPTSDDFFSEAGPSSKQP